MSPLTRADSLLSETEMAEMCQALCSCVPESITEAYRAELRSQPPPHPLAGANSIPYNDGLGWPLTLTLLFAACVLAAVWWRK